MQGPGAQRLSRALPMTSLSSLLGTMESNISYSSVLNLLDICQHLSVRNGKASLPTEPLWFGERLKIVWNVV